MTSGFFRRDRGLWVRLSGQPRLQLSESCSVATDRSEGVKFIGDPISQVIAKGTDG